MSTFVESFKQGWNSSEKSTTGQIGRILGGGVRIAFWSFIGCAIAIKLFL